MLRQATEDVMHEFDSELLGPIHRPAVTTGDPTTASPTSEVSPRHAPRAVHTEASLLHLQRTAGNAGVVQMLADEQESGQEPSSPVHDVIGKGGGAPLDESTRATMETSFGQDFGDVRLHTDARASASAEAVGANAYTVGNDVVFRSGHFDASSPTGQRTIAHELTHVVQQRSGPVDGTDAPGGIKLSDPDDRFERAADHTADQVVSGPSSSPAAASASQAPSLQLEAAEESELDMPVQREMGAEEDDEDAMGGGA
jgi:hypothetical protein